MQDPANLMPIKNSGDRRPDSLSQGTGPHRGQGPEGVSGETTAGMHRLYQLAEAKSLIPAINVNGLVTKERADIQRNIPKMGAVVRPSPIDVAKRYPTRNAAGT